MNFNTTLAVGIAVLGLAMAPAHGQTSLRLAVETTPGDPLNLMLSTFRDELAESELFTLDFFDGGALGDEVALTQLLRAGEVEVVPLGSDIVALDPHFALFDMPFLFEDKAGARAALDGELGDMLAQSLRETVDLQVLAFGELGFRVISNNVRPIETPEDLAGLKLRTPGSETRIMAFEMLGAAPTPMSLGEVYVALNQGVLDGQENPLSVVQEFSFHEVQDYVSLTNHVYTPITLSMNGSAWDALDSAQQEALLAAAATAAQATRAASDESDASLVEVFEQAGVAVNAPDLDAFRTAAAPIRDEIAVIVTPEFMAAAEEALQ